LLSLYQVDFPERPGALRRFLAGLSGRWNISLFHYRRTGAQARSLSV
jgi:threonine dehydratase